MNYTHTLIQNEKQEVQRLAYHESGHAWLCLHLNRTFQYVTVYPPDNLKEKFGYRGYVWNMEQRNDMDDALISYGGMMAEKILLNRLPHINEGSEIDMQQVDSILTKLYGPHSLTQGHRELMEKSEHLLRMNWPAVEVIAKALIERKTLTYTDCKKLIL